MIPAPITTTSAASGIGSAWTIGVASVIIGMRDLSERADGA